MLKITDRFTATRDSRGWTLTEQYTGKYRDGKPKIATRETYHANLKQVVMKVADIEAGHQRCLEEVIARMEAIHEEIAQKLGVMNDQA
jgi:Fe-S-cluster formation regulator IscX/YfhJ